ncbi:mpv17-like protein [Branchiostoma floridae x Branchiostoma japonicum]
MISHLRNVLRKSPYLTSVGLYTILYTGADVSNQLWTFHFDKKVTHEHSAFSLDLGRTARMGVIGFVCLGNFNYRWIPFLERMFPGATVRKTLAKVLVDQVIAAPLLITAFYAGLRVLERKPDVFAVVREKFVDTYKTGLMFWPAAQTINFYLLPVQYRVIFLGVCSFTWANIMCIMKARAEQEMLDTDAGKQQD